MIDDNFNKTQYQTFFQEYIDARKAKDIGGGGIEGRIGLIEPYLQPGAFVFEIGSGAGEDALEFQKRGYKICASDNVPKFVELCKAKGLEAIEFDAKRDSLPDNTEAVYANAVFVHFSPEETAHFLTRAKSKLVGKKLIFLSVLKGEGTERSGRTRGFERDFQYYSENQIINIVNESGFRVIETKTIDDKWIQVVAGIQL